MAHCPHCGEKVGAAARDGVSLGCGTLILIAIIVSMFSGRGGDPNDIDTIRSDVGAIRQNIQALTTKVDAIDTAVRRIPATPAKAEE